MSPGGSSDRLRSLQNHPDLIAVAGGYATIDARGREITALATGAEESDLTDQLLAGNTRTHLGTWLLRRAAWDAVGGARPWFACAEDLDLQCRLATQGRVVYLPGVAYRYRLHDASVTHTLADARRAFYDAAVVRFALERAAGGTDTLDAGQPPEPPEFAPVVAAPWLTARRQTRGHLLSAAHRAAVAGDRLASLALLRRALFADPTDLRHCWSVVRQAGSVIRGGGCADSRAPEPSAR